MNYIGIDPGKSGAIAILHGDGRISLAPFSEAEYDFLLRTLDGPSVCCLERVGAMPKQGVTSMFSFGVNFGFIQGLLTAHGVPFELVTPQRWKKEFGVTGDKNSSIAVAQRLFPSLDLRRTTNCRKPDDGICEALLMAEYARRRMGGVQE